MIYRAIIQLVHLIEIFHGKFSKTIAISRSEVWFRIIFFVAIFFSHMYGGANLAIKSLGVAFVFYAVLLLCNKDVVFFGWGVLKKWRGFSIVVISVFGVVVFHYSECVYLLFYSGWFNGN
ncbi:MAG: hypothetical protein NT086_16700 [Proteobacteria bacterium]|nr:hypothetical protein [Pseudomonadota bacterium]